MPQFAQLDEETEDYTEFMNERVKMQPFYEALNRPVPQPLSGEPLMGFKRRMLSDAKQWSPEHKDVNLYSVPISALRVFEPQIMSSAMNEINSPTRGNPDGSLREVREIDASGRPTIKFCGSPSSWMNMFRPDPKRLVGIRTETERGYFPSNVG
jgi:hypothetical protein